MSNDILQTEIQNYLFNRYGLLYEKKRGEFADGIFHGYIEDQDILERNLFFRMYFTSIGRIQKAREKRLFMSTSISFEELTKDNKLNSTYFAYLCFKKFDDARMPTQKIELNTYAKIYAMTVLFLPDKITDYQEAVERHFDEFSKKWPKFLSTYKNSKTNARSKTNRKTGITVTYQSYDYARWYSSNEFKHDLIRFYRDGISQTPDPVVEIGNEYVWYVTYGENMCTKTFETFILGGELSELGQKLRGCTDKSLPRSTYETIIDYPLYFARLSKKSTLGGLTMIGHGKHPNSETLAKMYLITKAQFIEILSQANIGNEVIVNFEEAITEGKSLIGSYLHYGNMIYLGTTEGCPAFTFSNPKQTLPPEKPTVAYLTKIVEALQGFATMNEDKVISYLINKQGIKDSYSQEQLNAIVQGRPFDFQ
jgi:hypothetical protein